MIEQERFELENEDGEICIRDNIRKKYIFTFVCEDIDMEEGMLEECEKVVNCLNQTWEQTQRFEKYNKEYIEDNEKLKRENEELKQSIDNMCGKLQGLWAHYNTTRHGIWADAVEDVAKELGFKIDKR